MWNRNRKNSLLRRCGGGKDIYQLSCTKQLTCLSQVGILPVNHCIHLLQEPYCIVSTESYSRLRQYKSTSEVHLASRPALQSKPHCVLLEVNKMRFYWLHPGFYKLLGDYRNWRLHMKKLVHPFPRRDIHPVCPSIPEMWDMPEECSLL